MTRPVTKFSGSAVSQCSVCGHNHKSECRFRNAICQNCGIKGHLMKMCRNVDVKPNYRSHYNGTGTFKRNNCGVTR